MYFFCEKLSYVNNVLIYPGVYRAEKEVDGYVLKSKKGQTVYIKEDKLFLYGYFCPVKYYFSQKQKRIYQEHKSDFSYVLVNGIWTEYTEIIYGDRESNFKDSILLVSSLCELPTMYSEKQIKIFEKGVIPIIHFNNNHLFEKEF